MEASKHAQGLGIVNRSSSQQPAKTLEARPSQEPLEPLPLQACNVISYRLRQAGAGCTVDQKPLRGPSPDSSASSSTHCFVSQVVT